VWIARSSIHTIHTLPRCTFLDFKFSFEAKDRGLEIRANSLTLAFSHRELVSEQHALKTRPTRTIDSGIARRDHLSRKTAALASNDPSYTSEMSKGLLVPLSHLVLYHREIGLHRGRRAGFRDVFGFRTLHDLPFVKLASKVKGAYEGRSVPSHDGWPAQREALQWLVDKGRDGIYALDDKGIKVRRCLYQPRYYIDDGHHRALALYILGESEIRARIKH